MGTETNLWLIRHAPVDGPRGVIHGPDAPADLGDTAAFAALKARLPANAFAVCSPARRTWETAVALGLDPVRQPPFANRISAPGPDGVTTISSPNSATPTGSSGNRRPSNRPPGGESFVDQIARAHARPRALPAGDVVLVVHSGTIRAVLAIALDLAPDSALRFVIDPLSLTRIDRLDERLARRRGQPAQRSA